MSDTFAANPLVNEMPPAEQEAFFGEALRQAADLPTPIGLQTTGPCYPAIRDALALSEERLRNLDPSLAADHIKWSIYSGVFKEVVSMPRIRQYELTELRQALVADLQGAAQKTAAHLRNQNVSAGVLTDPPYLQKTVIFDGLMRSSTNACFRMMFAGLTGQTVSEELLTHTMHAPGERVTDDEKYWKLFHTEAFARLCPEEARAIRVVDILGADLRVIDTIADRMKKRLRAAATFCVVSLELEHEGAYGGVVENCVLLRTDEQSVVMHDPNALRGSAYREIPRDEFARRWAVALNRAQFIIATPAQNIAKVL